jgi:hypothetical protein
MATWRVLPVVAVLVLAGCGGAGSSAAQSGATASGFPLGSVAKEVVDPDHGRVRIVWTFTRDGRFTEVQFPLDGQWLQTNPVRGTFTAAADRVTIAGDFPPGIGTSTHGWRRDGDRLWTFFVDSTNPDDHEFFEGIDSQPWIPAPP